MPTDPKRVQSLFLAASEQPADQRAAFLDRQSPPPPAMTLRPSVLTFPDRSALAPRVTLREQAAAAGAEG